MELLLKYFPDLTPKQVQQFGALQKLYEEWNQKINVISRKDMENFYLHHVLHSLSIAAKFNFPEGSIVLDLGTGGGFPGIPLAIYFPKIKFYLVDSINKKLKVVNEISSSIELKNINTQHARAEDIKNKKFDVVVSRAVAPLTDLWKWSKPLIRNEKLKIKNLESNVDCVSGLICLKGGDLNKEIFVSGVKPVVWEIEKIFEEDFFKEKYILHVR